MPASTGVFGICSTVDRKYADPVQWLHRSGRMFSCLLFSLSLVTIASAPASAQTPEILTGEAIVSQFSGTRLPPSGGTEPVLDPDGIVAQAVDLRDPATPPMGRPWRNAPKKLQISAAQVGQVFGIAFDDQSPPNVYLSATSAFGLHWDEAAGTWMEGQWGPGGDPGTIYKLDADNGYQPAIFALLDVDGRANSGAGLGNIAFDPQSSNLYVSDLESGLIFRLDLDGNIVGTYDHGVEGRAQFTDMATGQASSLPPIAFDPASDAQVQSCSTGVFSNTPQCWNIADFRRRIWGLAPHTDPGDGQTRLYYALWASQGFGNPLWDVDPTEQQNSIWSVGLAADGSFLTDDVRREFSMPGFFATQEDYTRAGGSNPVSDIAISADGEMALAERGGMRNLGLAADDPFAWPDESRTVRAKKNADGIWVPIGRHDISWYDRKDLGHPFYRAAGSGGVDFGFGYSPTGTLETDQRDAFVWSSGERLCRPESPCDDASGDGADILNGLQGQYADMIDELYPNAAYADYPVSGPATPAEGPAGSYFVHVLSDEISGGMGDIEIYKGAGSPPLPGEPELAISKDMPEFCSRGGLCTARIEVTNLGGGDWNGPIYLRDVTAPQALGFVAAGAPWECAVIGGETMCYHPQLTLKPGQSLPLVLDMAIGAAFPYTNLTNCAAVDWPLSDADNPANVVRAVQHTLTLFGYDPGPIDGAMGPKTSAAIAEMQSNLGMDVTGVIDADLLNVLYAGNAYWPGDANAGNDEACDSTEIIGTPPTGGIHLPVGSRPGHLAPASIHLPMGSNPGHLFPNSVHQPIGSGPAHVFPNSIHLPIGSNPGHLFPQSIHLPIGSIGGHQFPNSIHLPLGSGGHLFPQSIHLPIGSFGGHQFPQSIHLPIGSNPGHQFPQSIHLPIGSNPGHQFPQSIHLPIGSFGGHQFPQSLHLPIGSNPGHQFPQSIHLPIGSNPGHKFPQSIHLPIGSNPGHKFPQSIHFPLGSNFGHKFPQSVHLPIGSNPGHKFPQSLHLPLGSNPAHQFPQSIHLPLGSNAGHKFPQSLHLPLGSNPAHQFPQSVHLPIGSNPGHQFPASLHLPLGSFGGHKFPNSIHMPVGSNPQHQLPKSIHLPIGSGGGHQFPQSIHLPLGSAGHFPVGSTHMPVGSAFTPVPPNPIHKPVGSKLKPIKPLQPVHKPVGSKIKPIKPRPPIHKPAGSIQIHQPIGSKPLVIKPQPVKPRPQVHKPRGSVQVIKPQPVKPRPQVHKPRGSVQVIKPQPVKPRPQVHKPRGSVQVIKPQPVKPRPQVHKPRGSVQVIKPVKPRPQVQKPKPVNPRPQVHQPRGSVQVIKPQVLKPLILQPKPQKKQDTKQEPIILFELKKN